MCKRDTDSINSAPTQSLPDDVVRDSFNDHIYTLYSVGKGRYGQDKRKASVLSIEQRLVEPSERKRKEVKGNEGYTKGFVPVPAQ